MSTPNTKRAWSLLRLRNQKPHRSLPHATGFFLLETFTRKNRFESVWLEEIHSRVAVVALAVVELAVVQFARSVLVSRV